MSKFPDLSAILVPLGFRGLSLLVVQVGALVQATLFGLFPQLAY